jgi:hypothetical protein
VSAAPLEFKVRAQASEHFAGWEARARAAGVRVTAAPGRWGRLEYIARLGCHALAFSASPGCEQAGKAPASAAPLVQALEQCGVLRGQP